MGILNRLYTFHQIIHTNKVIKEVIAKIYFFRNKNTMRLAYTNTKENV